MRILWISSLAWKFESGYMYDVNGAGAVSGSLFQQSMIEGLEKAGHKIDIISNYPYADNIRKHYAFTWHHNNKGDDYTIAHVNIPYLSILYESKNLNRAVKVKLNKHKYDVVIAYLIHQPYLKALSIVKKISFNTKTVLICPDLPDMMDMALKERKVKHFLKKIDMKRIRALYPYIDGYVLFAEKMKECIQIEEKPYVVIEGIATLDQLDTTPVVKDKMVIYAGTLHKNIGIEQIIESLNHIEDKELKLVFFGTGDLENYIMKISKKNPRVVYGGFINRNALFHELKKGLALINARNPEDLYTKYSFPSKTFEYLYSGTPFITTKLEGVPDEYSEYLFEIKDNSPKTIAKEINRINKMPKEELLNKCLKGKEFIKREKCAKKQSFILTEFLDKLVEGD